MSNGINPLEAVTARTVTAAAGQQLNSADFNGVQDNIIAVSEALDLTRTIIPGARTSTINQADTPAPNTAGEVSVWVEALTDGTTVVALDDSVDWRDRFIIVQGGLIPEGLFANNRPGGALDNAFGGSISDPDALNYVFYSQAGQTGGNSTPGAKLTPTSYTDEWRLFARSTDGVLCMRKSANADADLGFIGKVTGSPVQNHY